jgi:hypothetical protein
MGYALDLNPVGLVLLMARIRKSMGERTIIRKEQESFAIEVEPACSVDIWRQSELRKGSARHGRSVCKLGQDPIGLIQQNDHGSRRNNFDLSKCG